MSYKSPDDFAKNKSDDRPILPANSPLTISFIVPPHKKTIIRMYDFSAPIETLQSFTEERL